MKRYCSKECKNVGPVCDFCKYYNFNGTKDGRYTGNGYCKITKKTHHPGGGCYRFVCGLLSLILLFTCCIAEASNILVINPQTNEIEDYLISRHTQDYMNDARYIINPDVSAVSNVPQKYWKYDNGKIREMSQAEKDALDAQEMDDANTATAKRIERGEYTTEEIGKALIDKGVFLDNKELTDIILGIAIPAP